jgi:hypothetical protein
VATPVRRVVDSSPLILLSKVGQLDLLRAGVPEILVPHTVLAEVGAPGPADPAFQQIRSTAWLKIVPAPPIPPLGERDASREVEATKSKAGRASRKPAASSATLTNRWRVVGDNE